MIFGTTRNQAADLGMLVLRVGIGVMFIAHGVPKLLGGPDAWAGLGGAMANLGLDFAPAFWGLCAALAESLGGLLIVVGAFTRLAASALATTMIVAVVHHITLGDDFTMMSHAIEAFIVFVSLVIIGPGRFSVDVSVRGVPSTTLPRTGQIAPAGTR